MKLLQMALAGLLVWCGGTAISPWAGGSAASAAIVTVNFDSLNASGVPGGVGGATLSNYLAGFGLSITDVTPGTQVVVFDARDINPDIQPVTAPSPFNVIVQTGLNTAVSYTLESDTLLDSFSLTRPLIDPGVTGIALPEWRATAFDALGTELGSVGENAGSFFGPDLAAQFFTLNGPGIASIRIDGNGFNFAAFSSMLFDDFVLTTPAAVPEPSSLLIFGSGALGLCLSRLVRRRKAQAAKS